MKKTILKPCPFCRVKGSKEKNLERTYRISPSSLIESTIRCLDCFAKGPIAYGATFTDSFDAANKLWNKRGR